MDLNIISNIIVNTYFWLLEYMHRTSSSPANTDGIKFVW